MHEIDLRGVDLNLLVTLEVLLQERHVTRAAARLGRSQSATSHALGRLREIFDDPLLIPSRGGMLCTPRAEALVAPLAAVLGQTRQLLQAPDAFSPSTTTRRVVIGCPDLLGVLFPALLERLLAQAPGLRVSLEPASPQDEPALASGALDVLLGVPHASLGAHIQARVLGRAQWVTLVRRDHPLAASAPDVTVEAWLRWPHVRVHTGNRSPSLIERALDAHDLTRQVHVTVPSFMLAAQVVACTDALFTAPHVLCAWAQPALGLVALRPPLPLPDVPAALMWHDRWQADLAHAWLRAALGDALSALWADLQAWRLDPT